MWWFNILLMVVHTKAVHESKPIISLATEKNTAPDETKKGTMLNKVVDTKPIHESKTITAPATEKSTVTDKTEKSTLTDTKVDIQTIQKSKPIVALAAEKSTLSTVADKTEKSTLTTDSKFKTTVTNSGLKGCPEIAMGMENIYIFPKVDDVSKRSGVWSTKDLGTLLKFDENLFTYFYDSIYLSLDHELFVTIAPHNSEIPFAYNRTALSVRDCNEDLMFELVELKKEDYFNYRIYDNNKTMLGYTKRDKFHRDQIRFYDHKDRPLAISQSPAIHTSNVIVQNPEKEIGKFSAYETQFIENKKSFLGLPHFRWIIPATVTVRSLRNALREKDGNELNIPQAYRAFQVLLIILGLIAVCVASYAFYHLYRCCFPKRIVEKEYSHYGKFYDELLLEKPSGSSVFEQAHQLYIQHQRNRRGRSQSQQQSGPSLR